MSLTSARARRFAFALGSFARNGLIGGRAAGVAAGGWATGGGGGAGGRGGGPGGLRGDAGRQGGREQSDAAPPVLESPQTAAQAAPREAVPPMDATESAPP